MTIHLSDARNNTVDQADTDGSSSGSSGKRKRAVYMPTPFHPDVSLNAIYPVQRNQGKEIDE